MPFIYVDRVIELHRLERIVAVRQMTIGEEIFQQHFPGNPMLPASLIIEACAQAATILLEASCEFRLKAFVGFVDKSKFRDSIRPGYEMRMDLKIEQGGQDGAILRGSVHQRGKKCATVGLGIVTAPMSDFFLPHQLPTYLNLFRGLLEDTEFKGFDRHPLTEFNHE